VRACCACDPSRTVVISPASRSTQHDLVSLHIETVVREPLLVQGDVTN